ncbi:hypothetical protein D3C71_1551480 [compost metagenome]
MTVEFESDRVKISEEIFKLAMETNWTPGKHSMTLEDHKEVLESLKNNKIITSESIIGFESDKTFDFYVKHIKETAKTMKKIKVELYFTNSNHSDFLITGVENWIKRADNLQTLDQFSLVGNSFERKVMTIIKKFVRLANHMVTNKYFNSEHKENVEWMRDLLESFITMEKLTK